MRPPSRRPRPRLCGPRSSLSRLSQKQPRQAPEGSNQAHALAFQAARGGIGAQKAKGAWDMQKRLCIPPMATAAHPWVPQTGVAGSGSAAGAAHRSVLPAVCASQGTSAERAGKAGLSRQDCCGRHAHLAGGPVRMTCFVELQSDPGIGSRGDVGKQEGDCSCYGTLEAARE